MKTVIVLTLLISLCYLSHARLETGSICSLFDSKGEPIPDPCPSLHACEEGKCKHKTILNPTPWEVIGSIILFIFSGIASAGGVGAAYSFGPIATIFMNYSTNAAIRCISISSYPLQKIAIPTDFSFPLFGKAGKTEEATNKLP